MQPLGVLGPLDTDWFVQNKVLGCPHPHVPSDHLPLLVEFQLRQPSNAPGPGPISQSQSGAGQSNGSNPSNNGRVNSAPSRR